MKTYRNDSEDVVQVADDGTYTTYTAGTQDPLYRGPIADAARDSLEMSEAEWCGLLASDATEDI